MRHLRRTISGASPDELARLIRGVHLLLLHERYLQGDLLTRLHELAEEIDALHPGLVLDVSSQIAAEQAATDARETDSPGRGPSHPGPG